MNEIDNTSGTILYLLTKDAAMFAPSFFERLIERALHLTLTADEWEKIIRKEKTPWTAK